MNHNSIALTLLLGYPPTDGKELVINREENTPFGSISPANIPFGSAYLSRSIYNQLLEHKMRASEQQTARQ